MIKHDPLACSANICMASDDRYLTNWYPGEPVCTARPYFQAQRVQLRINRLLTNGKLKYPAKVYSLKDLEKIKFVRPGIKGHNPYYEWPVAKKMVSAIRESSKQKDLMDRRANNGM